MSGANQDVVRPYGSRAIPKLISIYSSIVPPILKPRTD